LFLFKNQWSGDHLDFRASLLGQSTTGTVDVAEDHVRLEVRLPWLLSMVANKAKVLVEKQGKLMLEKRSSLPRREAEEGAWGTFPAHAASRLSLSSAS
jgi:hypothetical protein